MVPSAPEATLKYCPLNPLAPKFNREDHQVCDRQGTSYTQENTYMLLKEDHRYPKRSHIECSVSTKEKDIALAGGKESQQDLSGEDDP